MIQTMMTPNGGTVIYRTVGRGRRRSRMRLYGLIVVGLMACSGGVLSAFSSTAAFESRTSVASAEMLPPGPFSYFPH